MNVARHLGLGSSVCHVLRESQVLGYPRSNKAVEPGGSATEGPHARGGSELGSHEDLMNVSRILVLGAHSVVFYEVLRLWGGSNY